MTGPAGAAERPVTDRMAPLWWLWLPLVFLAMVLLTANLVPETYARYIDSEHGAMETLQALHTLIAMIVALTAIPLARARGKPWLVAYLALAALACFYVTGEELSWGQHFVGWSTPEHWAAINDQGETNLHNLGAILNEVPRHILSASVIIGGLVIPLAATQWPVLYRNPLAIILPPTWLWLTALLSAFCGLLREKDWIGGLELVPHASEPQESFLYWFVLLYLIVLKRRIRAL